MKFVICDRFLFVFSDTPVSSAKKTDCNEITVQLLKVALITYNPTPEIKCMPMDLNRWVSR